MSFLHHIWNQIQTALQTSLFQLGGATITVWTILQLLILSILLISYAPKLNSALLKQLSSRLTISRDLRKFVVRISRIAVLIAGFFIILKIVGLSDWVLAQLFIVYSFIQKLLDLKLFKLGNTQITLLTVFYVLTLSWMLVRMSARVHHFVAHRILGKTKMDIGLREAVGSLTHYLVLFLGLIILLQTAGIDLSGVTVMLGALGIGISFGLQTITNNFISGLIILFERPIKIGDRIQIGDVTGEVINISLRATTVLTNEGIAIVVPNQEFVSSKVVNWTFTGRTIGIKFPVTVAPGYDPRQVQGLILECVRNASGVLKSPEPSVLLDEISKDTMRLTVRLWTKDFLASPEDLISELNFAINKKLSTSGVDVTLHPGSKVMFTAP